MAAPLQGIYSAAKHAVKGYTDVLLMELEQQRVPIWVTLVEPGPIATPYTQHARNYLTREPRHPQPTYPPEARQAGMEGTVLVWLRVSADGKVMEVRLERTSGHMILDHAALRFAYTVRLQPARQGATPVEGEAKLPVVYRLLD